MSVQAHRKLVQHVMPSEASALLERAQRLRPPALEHLAERTVPDGTGVLGAEEPYRPLAVGRRELGEEEIDVAVLDAADDPCLLQRDAG